MDITYYNELKAYIEYKQKRILKQKKYKIVKHKKTTLLKEIEYEIRLKIADYVGIKNIIELEGQKEIVDTDYINYLFYKYLRDMVEYIAGRGIFLVNIEQNIKIILNKITDGEIREEHYERIISKYAEINDDTKYIYDIIDTAIDLNNYEILYYIYYMEEEDILKRINILQ